MTDRLKQEQLLCGLALSVGKELGVSHGSFVLGLGARGGHKVVTMYKGQVSEQRVKQRESLAWRNLLVLSAQGNSPGGPAKGLVGHTAKPRSELCCWQKSPVTLALLPVFVSNSFLKTALNDFAKISPHCSSLMSCYSAERRAPCQGRFVHKVA